MQIIVSKKIKIIFIIILLLGVCFSTISTAQSKNKMLQIKTEIIKMITENRGQILYVGGTGSDNYTTIQNAIDDAINGDTVFVYPGTYNENLIINKSIQLIGWDKINTIIQGSGIDDVVKLQNDHINIENFKIENSGSTSWDAGIEVNSNHSSIKNNTINNNNNNGMNIIVSHHNIVFNNTIISNTGHAISLQISSNNSITNNIIHNNIENGIYLQLSNNNKIQMNNISQNSNSIFLDSSNLNNISNNELKFSSQDGIQCKLSMENSIYKNLIINNQDDGIQLYQSEQISIIENHILKNVDGIFLQSYCFYNEIFGNIISNNSLNSLALESNSDNNVISKNTFERAIRGLYLSESKNNIISENLIQKNNYGMLLPINEVNNIINRNIIKQNDYGIYISSNDSYNEIYHNTFENNSRHAYDLGKNTLWDNDYPSGGNYWDDYNGTDQDGDGIGDTPYPIDFTNEDRYPLGFFNTPHIPIIFGPTNGEAGKIYNYSILTIDPNNDDVYFYIDWGDGVFDEWIGPYSSGNEIIISHTWNVRGIYTIRVKAKDIHNFESGWGTLEIEMPLSFSSTFSSKSFIINRILGLLYGSNKIIFQ